MDPKDSRHPYKDPIAIIGELLSLFEGWPSSPVRGPNVPRDINNVTMMENTRSNCSLTMNYAKNVSLSLLTRLDKVLDCIEQSPMAVDLLLCIGDPKLALGPFL